MHYTLLFRPFAKKNIPTFISIYQKKSCFNLELDSKTKAKKDISKEKKYVSEFIVDETIFKVGDEFVFLWVAIEPLDKVILGIRISLERSMLIAEHFLRSLVRKYGKHPVSTDGGTWYPQACKFLKIKHHLHSSYERNIIE